MRIAQPVGAKGSLKWIQIAVNDRSALLGAAVQRATGIESPIEWVSPLRSLQFEEYRDGAFLSSIGCDHLSSDLEGFWPKRGPQWDALGCAAETRLLVEAKSHLKELFSPPTAARGASLAQIQGSLAETSSYLSAKPNVPWGPYFYQLVNRIAHLWFLRRNAVDARLLLVNFLGDSEMNGPKSALEWEAAYEMARLVLGLPTRHKLSDAIHHVYISVSDL